MLYILKTFRINHKQKSFLDCQICENKEVEDQLVLSKDKIITFNEEKNLIDLLKKINDTGISFIPIVDGNGNYKGFYK